MGQDSKISWCRHTFNPWWGCTKVGGSPACDFCYAESFAKRVGFGPAPKSAEKFPIWGDPAARRFFGDDHWQKPLAWNEAAAAQCSLDTVFCMSMGDWAEGRPDQAESLARLWRLQGKTESLIWLMLTKRPQLIRKLCPPGSPGEGRRWFGTTAETQEWLDLRWKHLRAVDSPVYWLSIEPIMGPIMLPRDFLELGRRAWVIVGGESGTHARPANPKWILSLRDQCIKAAVHFHFKQWGEWTYARSAPSGTRGRYALAPRDFEGSIVQTDEYPRQFAAFGSNILQRIGTKDAGAMLQGREWREIPSLA